MLSVLTVDEVEKRFGGVSGVESATVSYAAGNATVRYDETLLNVADIKVMVHQRGHQSEGEAQAKQTSEHKSAPAPAPEAAVLKDSPVAPASAAPSADAHAGHDDHTMKDAPPAPAATAPGA